MNFKRARIRFRGNWFILYYIYTYKDTLCTSIFFRAKMNKSSFDQCRFENTSFKRIERYEVSKVHRADAVWLHLDNNNLRWFFFSPLEYFARQVRLISFDFIGFRHFKIL